MATLFVNFEDLFGEELDKKLEIAQRELRDFPVHLLDEEDAGWLVGQLNAKVCAHHKCGHRRIFGDYLPEEGEFLFVAKCNGEFIVHIKMEGKCPSCEARDKKEVMKPDSLLQLAIYSHGIASGYSGNKSLQDIEATISAFESIEGEVCGSWKTQQIGGFGLFIKGEVTLASNIDLCSFREGGERVYDMDHWRAEGVFSRREELDFSRWDHTEFFVKRPKIVAVWVKDWFYRSVPGCAEMVERLRNAGRKVYIVGKRH